ncbi:transketolase [Deltaproteobacteria bacterium Smac51]|nr:transketolase [Deltaproteobacteria bacterium Smac51]
MAVPSFNRKDQASVNTMRLLAADMVEKAKSGHPGLPLGAAPMAYVLLSRFLKHNPADPAWPDRDRFILSAGHGSALLYAWLHLAGYGLSLDELKDFRQWGSLTPGHPEHGHTPGVDATTGPLGHGFAMGVGMAMAEKMMADRFNRPEFNLFDHKVYAIVSDGDLMEGVSSEAASLAGTLSLGNLIYLYDDNSITIEGRTGLAFTEDVRGRFLAYGWQVIVVTEGEDLGSIYMAIENAVADKEHPSLIMVKTKIGAGSPKADSPKAHGEPLGSEAIKATRAFYGYPEDQEFTVDERVYENFKTLSQPHLEAYNSWGEKLAAYEKAYPVEAAELKRRLAGELPEGWADGLPSFEKGKAMATRIASGQALNALAAQIPELIGGSADLSPSNKSSIDDGGSFSAHTPSGRNIHFGVREEAMGAAVNGMALYGGIRPYGATFMVFSDFVRPALRLASLMKLPATFIFTHDSIGVGEDGPTHQPIEHLAALRAIPGLAMIRPADGYETVAAWRVAVKRKGPTALALSRQNLPTLHPDDFPSVIGGPEKGGYILSEAEGGAPEALIMASGSEVSLALEAQKLLTQKGRKVRVVSMPSWELFNEQSAAYRDEVLPREVKKRLSVEAGISMGWERYTGNDGKCLSIESFGASAPAERVFKEMGFTAENVAALVESL